MLKELRARHSALFIAGLLVSIANFGLLSSKITTKLVYADSAKVVSLFADGQKRVITTDASTVGDLLNRAGVVMGKNDLVQPAADTPIPQGFYNVNVYRAHPILVIDAGKEYYLHTAYESPRLAAQSAGLTLYPEDDFSVETVTNFVGDGLVGEKITVLRATPVSIRVDGKVLPIRTQAKTVGGLLAQSRVPLGEKDTVVPGAGSPLQAGTAITITRVSDVTDTVNETVSRPVQTITDPNLPKGQSEVKTEGADGHRTVTYHIRYNNGIEVLRETLKVENDVKPQTRVVVVGTKVFFSGSVEYWRPYVEAAAATEGTDPNLMMAIMTCESRGNANASNGNHFGLYQYDQPTWANVGGTMANVYDGPTQISRTAWKIAHYGTSAWAASKFCWANF